MVPYRRQYLLIAAMALITSVYFGANIYNYQMGLFSKLHYVLFVITLTAGAFAVIKLEGQLTKILLTAWVLLISLSAFTKGFFPAAFGYLATVCLLLGLYLHYQYKIKQAAGTD